MKKLFFVFCFILISKQVLSGKLFNVNINVNYDYAEWQPLERQINDRLISYNTEVLNSYRIETILDMNRFELFKFYYVGSFISSNHQKEILESKIEEEFGIEKYTYGISLEPFINYIIPENKILKTIFSLRFRYRRELYFGTAKTYDELYFVPYNSSYNYQTNSYDEYQHFLADEEISFKTYLNNYSIYISLYGFTIGYYESTWAKPYDLYRKYLDDNIPYIFEKTNNLPIYEFEAPGSIFDVDLSDDGVYCTFGGKAVHARIMGCGGTLYGIKANSEVKILSSGWNWESFPRLERDANGNVNAPLLFSEIQNFAPGVEFFETIAYNSNLKYYSDPGYWTSDPWYIQSPWLYKIDVDPEDDWILELCGERLSPTEFVSSPDPQNPNFLGDGTWYWLGYWLPNTQDMDVAFPENVWQWVKHVKAEEWYYGIPENNRDPVIEPKPSNQMRALEYGKGYMVQFKTVDEGFPEEGLPPFQWSTGETSEGYERIQAENFVYDEFPDYEVIDVLGIPENVIEIGVFQDSVCVGAVVVQDSSEQILVYVENSLRDQIPYNFEVVTNNRSIEEVIDYTVFNNDEGIFEQRSLIASSHPYSVVKFGNIGFSQNSTPNINKIVLHNNYPNPFNPETNISFSIPAEQKINLTIYNLKGQKVRELINGQFVSGEHSVVWNGKDDYGKQVVSGLYFYKLKTENKEISKKMLLLK